MNKKQRKQIDSIYKQMRFNLKLTLRNICALCSGDDEKVEEIFDFLNRHKFISLSVGE